MQISIKPGTYVVAVSGGVDSMVLLDVLAQKPKVKLIVAHFDHGIRSDSSEDRKFVQAAAKHYGLPYVSALGKLGPAASEATARTARYAFLRKVQEQHQARSLVTAHHQDDMLETAILNLLRGTGRRGMSSLYSSQRVVRPLLHYTKKDICNYAKEHELAWREDSTNADDRYLRNYIRHNILTRFGETGRAALLDLVEHARSINQKIDSILEHDLAKQPARNQLDRGWYLALPYTVAREVMATWLRRNGIVGFDRNLLDYLVVASKTKQAGKQADVVKGYALEFGKQNIKLVHRGDQ